MKNLLVQLIDGEHFYFYSNHDRNLIRYISLPTSSEHLIDICPLTKYMLLQYQG